MYIIKRCGKRYNSKKFPSYDEARKYVRRLITIKHGGYRDNIGDFEYTIEAK